MGLLHHPFLLRLVRLGYCFTPYQRPRLYNDAPLVAFYDTLGIRRTYSRLKPPASSPGGGGGGGFASFEQKGGSRVDVGRTI